MENQQNEKAVSIRYNKDFYIIQANELVRSKQDELTILEAKLIRLAISQVLKDDTDLKTYTCNTVDLGKFLGIDRGNLYKAIQDLSTNIMKKSIFIIDRSKPTKKNKPNYKVFHWVDSVEYLDGIITFKLSDSLKPYLLGLEELFTRYPYEAIIGLPTNYSIRLYELIASYQNMTARTIPETNYSKIPIEKDEFIFTIDYLRDYFNCNEKYPNTGDFIRRVIDSSVNAILKKTLMRLSYRTIKTGRTITHIVFKLNSWDNTDFTSYIRKLKEG